MAVLRELTRETVHPLSSDPAQNTKILKKALELLNDPEQLPITVAELCTRVGASSSTLNRIFLSEYGIPPKSYIRAMFGELPSHYRLLTGINHARQPGHQLRPQGQQPQYQ
jgi:AraC-like DNA-binding protein